jgi:hypothetical protein
MQKHFSISDEPVSRFRVSMTPHSEMSLNSRSQSTAKELAPTAVR